MLPPAERVFFSCHRSFQGLAHAIKDTTKQCALKSGCILVSVDSSVKGFSYDRPAANDADNADGKNRVRPFPRTARVLTQFVSTSGSSAATQAFSLGRGATCFVLTVFRLGRNVVVNPFQNYIGDL